MLARDEPLPTVEEAPEADYPEEWAKYRGGRENLLTVRFGEAGRCGGCGRFKTKKVSRLDGYPPTLIDGQVCFDAGFEEVRYTCRNSDCTPDNDW